MGRLKLSFLQKENIQSELNPIEKIMHEFGQEIYEYAKGYFNYIVTTTSFEDDLKEASLYIIVPEIGYDYKILELSYVDVENVELKFFTLKTREIEVDRICFKKNWDLVYDRISELLSTPLANQTFKFLVEQVDMKRENREE